MGRGGDGLGAPLDDGAAGQAPIAVPYTLPGEHVTADVSDRTGSLVSVEQPSSERTEPLCRHFGPSDAADAACGACALQHWRAEPYRAWKRDLLVSALARAGLHVPVDPLVPCEPASRRRLVLAAQRTERGVVLGFNALRSDRIVQMEECPVAVPAIVAALPELRDLLGAILPRAARARVSVLATQTGLDVNVDGEGVTATGPIHVPHASIARLSLMGETVHERAAPLIRFGDVEVIPPPGAFVQAVENAEAAMATLITDHLRGARHVADLYSGSGAFALRLAASASVHAVEGAAEPLTALDRAWRRASNLRRVTTERRDLDRRPLQPAELEGRDGPRSRAFDGMVIDPPRAGAEAQSRAVARANVARVAAVSCNPITFARDLAIMVAGGYRIERVVPIDQFLFTPHLEAVALLTRD